MGKKMVKKNLTRKLSAISDMLDEDDDASHSHWRQRPRKNSGFSDSSGRDDGSEAGSFPIAEPHHGGKSTRKLQTGRNDAKV